MNNDQYSNECQAFDDINAYIDLDGDELYAFVLERMEMEKARQAPASKIPRAYTRYEPFRGRKYEDYNGFDNYFFNSSRNNSFLGCSGNFWSLCILFVIIVICILYMSQGSESVSTMPMPNQLSNQYTLSPQLGSYAQYTFRR